MVEHVLRDVGYVVFDVGETLVDESRLWMSVADKCGVPLATVCGVLSGLSSEVNITVSCGTS